MPLKRITSIRSFHVRTVSAASILTARTEHKEARTDSKPDTLEVFVIPINIHRHPIDVSGRFTRAVDVINTVIRIGI